MIASKQRLLADLIAAGEAMADRLDAFDRDEIIAIGKETGEPLVEWTSNRPGGVHGYGYIAVREWQRLLDDARREGVVP